MNNCPQPLVLIIQILSKVIKTIKKEVCPKEGKKQ